jgi:uncharacterized protein YndB with AHSA1/START domain
MVGRENDGIWVTLKETVHAPPAEVAACITSASGFCRWLAVDCEFEGSEGTTLAISWDRNWVHSTEVKVLEFDGEHFLDGRARIKFEWYPSALEDTPTPIELAVTPVAARGDGTTGARVILRQGPFADDAEALIFMADSAESWRWYLCNLRSVLEQKHDMRAVRPL